MSATCSLLPFSACLLQYVMIKVDEEPVRRMPFFLAPVNGISTQKEVIRS